MREYRGNTRIWRWAWRASPKSSVQAMRPRRKRLTSFFIKCNDLIYKVVTMFHVVSPAILAIKASRIKLSIFIISDVFRKNEMCAPSLEQFLSVSPCQSMAMGDAIGYLPAICSSHDDPFNQILSVKLYICLTYIKYRTIHKE